MERIGLRLFNDAQEEVVLYVDGSTKTVNTPSTQAFYISNSHKAEDFDFEYDLDHYLLDLDVQEELAWSIAEPAFKDITDRGGTPYVEHLRYVSEHAQTRIGRIVGVLHDLFEDTEWTRRDLLQQGVDQSIVDIVELVTHNGAPSDKEYLDYIDSQVSQSVYSADVKLADLRHNQDLSRLPRVTGLDMKRVGKYAKAENILLEKFSQLLT